MADRAALESSEWVPAGAGPGSAWTLRVPWLAAALLLAAVAGFLGGSRAGAVAGFVTLLLAWLWVRAQGRLALRSLRAFPVTAEDEPRLAKLVRGICLSAPATAPRLWLIPQGGPNALVCRAPAASLAVSRSMLDSYTRTELEAVVALCLVRMEWVAALEELTALGPLRSRFAPQSDLRADGAAASLTRYPPALASAIARAEPPSDRFEPLWFVAEGSSRTPQATRRDAAADL